MVASHHRKRGGTSRPRASQSHHLSSTDALASWGVGLIALGVSLSLSACPADPDQRSSEDAYLSHRDSDEVDTFASIEAGGSELAMVDDGLSSDAGTPALDASADGLDAGSNVPDGAWADTDDAIQDGAGETVSSDTTPVAGCGDGVVDDDEACDDGNVVDGDWCSADCGTLHDVSAYTPYPSATTYGTLTTANGFSAAVFDSDAATGQHKLVTFREHMYDAYDPVTPSVDILYDLYAGLRINGFSDASSWLSGSTPTKLEYVGDSGMIRVTHATELMAVETTYTVPFHGEAERVLLVSVKVTNTSSTPLTDTSLFLLSNFHLGGEGDPADESLVAPGNNVLVESRDGLHVVYLPLGPAKVTADAGGQPQNPYVRVAAGQTYEGFVPSMVLDDIAVGHEFVVAGADGAMAPGESLSFGLAIGLARDVTPEQAATKLEAWVDGRTSEDMLAAEVSWWEQWHAEGKAVALDDDALSVYRRANTVLKMAQVRETSASGCPSDACYGQILASLVPGQWNICWVRDAAYAIVGLVRAGHYAEARAGLDFMLGGSPQPMPAPGQGNYYQQTFIESTDPSPGIWGLGVDLPSDYAISVTRYYGSGLEESDANANGPNIEWDNWGLFLWAFMAYVDGSGDTAYLAQHWSTITTRVADLLVALIDPETGLLLPDSSIWERHWCPHGACDEPETRKRHAYSSILAAHSLSRMAALASQQGDSALSESYTSASQTLVHAILTELVVTQVPGTGQPALAGNYEELPYATYYLDAAAVEAINLGIVAPGSRLAFGTIAAFDTYLSKAGSPGYKRNDDPTYYDEQEWVVMDLRVVNALVAMGQLNRARTLMDWVTGQALANYGLFAELLSDGAYAGAIPMTGFGPGAWILAYDAAYGLSPSR